MTVRTTTQKSQNKGPMAVNLILDSSRILVSGAGLQKIFHFCLFWWVGGGGSGKPLLKRPAGNVSSGFYNPKPQTVHYSSPLEQGDLFRLWTKPL